MADSKSGADYGPATKEEHQKSGYRLPDSFYEESNPSDPTIKGGQKRGSGPAENKAATPAVETKKEEASAPAATPSVPARPAARKAARKSTRGKRK